MKTIAYLGGLLWTLCLCEFTWAVPPNSAKGPNVILFLVDDMGWMDCSPYGSKYYDTPNMERLAMQSMRFTQAYSQPLCSPTRASLLTGQYSSRHGITSATGHLPPQAEGFEYLPKAAAANRVYRMPESKNFLEPSQYTLAEALCDAGYRTAHIGKWHLGLTEPYWPEKQGFDFAFHCHPDPGPPGNYFSPYKVLPTGQPKGQSKVGTITDGPEGEYITDRLTDEAIKFIEASESARRAEAAGKPFFLNLWHYGVHGPWGHKAALTAQYAKRIDPTGRQGNPIMASMLKSVDESLGRILDKLDELKIADNTILIFTSDNGGNTHSMTAEDAKSEKRKKDDPALLEWRRLAGNRPPTNNAPLRDGKGRLYEGGIRVPLMVRWHGKVQAAATSDAVVGCIDVYPTVLELAGIAPSPQQKIDGVSYASVLKKTGTLSRDAYFIWFPHLIPGVVVRQGDWKLIRRYEARPSEFDGLHELFNLREDLSETTNLAAKMPEKVQELDALIDRFLKETGAIVPQPNPNFKAQANNDAASKSPPATDPAAGLVARSCQIELVAGALKVEANGRSPFLGTAQVKHRGAMTLKLRARCNAGGSGKVQWKTADQSDFPTTGQTAEFKMNAGSQWQEISVSVPAAGDVSIVRLYLPADSSAVEIESIQYLSAETGKLIRQWNFKNAKP